MLVPGGSLLLYIALNTIISNPGPSAYVVAAPLNAKEDDPKTRALGAILVGFRSAQINHVRLCAHSSSSLFALCCVASHMSCSPRDLIRHPTLGERNGQTILLELHQFLQHGLQVGELLFGGIK